MTRIGLSSFVMATALALAATATAQTTFSDLVGRPLTNDNGTVMINAGGTVSGEARGGTVNLTWDVEDGKYCRQGTVGSNSLPRVCQTIRIRGDQVSFINPDGTVSSTYTIN